MAKKGELNEEIQTETEVSDEGESNPAPKKVSQAKATPINIMDTKDSAEPPKRKEKDEPAIDLSPVLESIEKGFKDLGESLTPKETKSKSTPKTEESDRGFHEYLGDW